MSNAGPILRIWWRIGLAICSGLLYWCAFPGVDMWPLAFVCWAPLLVALHGQSPRAALGLGFVQGLVCNVAGFFWLAEVLRTFVRTSAAVSIVLMVLVCAYNAGRGAMLGWLSARAAKKGHSLGLAFALALAASEVAYPLLFPWYSAAQVHSVPLLLQLAEIGGPIAIGVALCGSSVALAEIGWARLEARAIDRVRVALALLAPLTLVAFGAMRLPAIDRAIAEAPKATIGLVQGNLDQAGKKHASATTIHRAATATLPDVDLVVWPETAVSTIVSEGDLATYFGASVARAPDGHGHLRAPLLTGAIVRRGAATANSAVLVDPDGRPLGVYDKVHPLAFGETLPLEATFPRLRRWLPNAGNVAPGTSLSPLRLGEHSIGVLICYEDILSGFTNDVVRAGNPDLLVNLTNDVWFGDSAAPRIHYALAKLRAVEHRRFLVRASNTGVSGFVDPAGRTFGETPTMRSAVRTGEIGWMRAHTVYERVGDAPFWGAALVVFGMGFVARRARVRTVHAAAPAAR